MKSKIQEYLNLKTKNMRKTTLLSGALLLSVLAVNAQSEKKVNEKKETKVRIKKVENINGVETVTDTTYTVSDPSQIKLGDGNDIQMIDIEDGKNQKTSRVFITSDGNVVTTDDAGMNKMEIKTDGTEAEIEKALKEAGIDPKDCKGTKKMVFINEETGDGKNSEEKKITKIVMIKMNITDASPEDMKRLGTQIGKTDSKLEMAEMKMFPNPHDGKFNLSFNLKNKGDAKVSIFNIEGKEVYSEKLSNFSGEYNKDIDISNNKKGIYFVKIEQGSHSQVKKVVLE